MTRPKTILAFIFLAQAACFSSTSPAAEGNKDDDQLKQLIPPVTVKSGPITGSGKDRDGELVVKNDGDRSISGMFVEMLLLRSDASVSSSVSNTLGVFPGHAGRNTLERGESYSFKVGKAFIENDMAKVEGLVKKITFTDNSTWPPMPSPPPAQKNGEPVAIKMIGVLGTGSRAQPVVACYNYGSKPVQAVDYNIEYLDAGGKTLNSTSYGRESNKPIMESGSGTVISGGDAPPDKATNVRVTVTSVKFSDK